MTSPAENGHPPAWAEAILRALLPPRNRDTVSGDLLEEYSEVVLPQRGELGAKLWYLRQVVSFIIPGFVHASTVCWQEASMFDRFSRTSWPWLVAGIIGFVALLGALVESDFRPPAGLGVFITLALVLTAASLTSWPSRGDTRILLRIGLAAGLLVTMILVTRLLFDVLAPVDPLDRFLAQARDDYSELNYPRRWIPAAAVTVTLMGGGLLAAWRTGRVGMGTLGAIVASASGSGLYVVLVALANLVAMGAYDSLGNAPQNLQALGNVPTMLVPVLVMFSAVLGTIGALFGRALGSAGVARSHG